MKDRVDAARKALVIKLALEPDGSCPDRQRVVAEMIVVYRSKNHDGYLAQSRFAPDKANESKSIHIPGIISVMIKFAFWSDSHSIALMASETVDARCPKLFSNRTIAFAVSA